VDGFAQDVPFAGAARVADDDGSSSLSVLQVVALALAAALTAFSGLWLILGRRRSRDGEPSDQPA
jgi:hypothetical protein